MAFMLAMLWVSCHRSFTIEAFIKGWVRRHTSHSQELHIHLTVQAKVLQNFWHCNWRLVTLLSDRNHDTLNLYGGSPKDDASSSEHRSISALRREWCLRNSQRAIRDVGAKVLPLPTQAVTYAVVTVEILAVCNIVIKLSSSWISPTSLLLVTCMNVSKSFDSGIPDVYVGDWSNILWQKCRKIFSLFSYLLTFYLGLPSALNKSAHWFKTTILK